MLPLILVHFANKNNKLILFTAYGEQTNHNIFVKAPLRGAFTKIWVWFHRKAL